MKRCDCDLSFEAFYVARAELHDDVLVEIIFVLQHAAIDVHAPPLFFASRIAQIELALNFVQQRRFADAANTDDQEIGFGLLQNFA